MPLDEVTVAEPPARGRLGGAPERRGRGVGRASTRSWRAPRRPAPRCSTATSTSTATASSTPPSRSSTSKPDVAQAVVDAYEKARAWALENPEDTAALLAEVAGWTSRSRPRSSPSAPTWPWTRSRARRSRRARRRSAGLRGVRRRGEPGPHRRGAGDAHQPTFVRGRPPGSRTPRPDGTRDPLTGTRCDRSTPLRRLGAVPASSRRRGDRWSAPELVRGGGTRPPDATAVAARRWVRHRHRGRSCRSLLLGRGS